MKVMKKNYNQPMVEATDLIAGGQALCASPNIIINPDPISNNENDSSSEFIQTTLPIWRGCWDFIE